jgi:putative ABC transport system ATP-binding protein
VAGTSPVTAEPLVRVEGLSKAYRSGSLETPVLRDVDLVLPRWETSSLVGVSGSGKSTLISLVAGLLLPDEGRVLFNGRPIDALTDKRRARLRARRIGIVLQRGNLIPFLTAAENVELAVELSGGGRAASRARALLGGLGLADRADHLPRRLSGGEAQRVSLAMALANDPELLLADEVSGELDSATAELVMGVIFDACRERGLTVLYVTHSTELAARADHRLRLEDGRIRSE